MAVLFPDIEPILVAHLKDTLPDYGYGDTYVATIKAQPDNPQTSQVIITASYGQTLDDVRREASAVLDVYADDYETASDLGMLVGTLILSVPFSHIKKATVTLGPVRQSDEAPQEKRSMSVDFVVKGSTL